MNKAWECPRCKRMNAPFNPVCFCQPETKVNWNQVFNPTMAAHCNDCGEMLNGLTKHVCKVSM